MKILVIGGGNMGLTYAKSFLRSHIVTSENMIILEKSPKKAEELRKLNIGTVYGKPGAYIKDADILILAVKPQDVKMVFENFKPYVNDQQLVMSIMAGVTMETISQGLGCKKIIRAMPNLPAQVGMGMTVFHGSPDVTRIELVMVQNLLSSTGKTVYVDNQDDIDSATAISGSGPAYVFYFMQSLIDSAKGMGYAQSQAELLTYQTFRGALELYNKYDFSCQEWIEKVSSRGGTTEAAFNVFKSDELSKLFMKGVHAAKERAKVLSATS